MATQERLIGYKELTDIYSEYQAEYANAVDYVGAQIWASIQRHNGDPRWEWPVNKYGVHVEFCR